MALAEFADYVRTALDRVTDLQLRARQAPPDDAPAALVEALEELTTAFAQLEAAREEMRALTDAREAADVAAAADRDRYRDLFEFAPCGLVVTDGAGVIGGANVAARRLLNADLRDLANKPLGQFVWDPDWTAYKAQVAALQRGQPAGATSLRFRPRGDRAEPRAADVTVVPFRDPAARAPLLRWQLADATDRRRAADEIDRLRAADRRKDAFVAVLAHELRNPLTPILNAAQVVAAKADGDPVVRRAAAVITRQADRMSRLVEDLFDAARIAQGKVVLQADVVDLRAAVEEAAEAARPRAADRRVRLTVTLPADPLWVRADPSRLDQIAANLVENAVKYTDAGGSVAVAVARDGAEAVVRVTDTGVGLAADALPHVFDLYAQAGGADGVDGRSRGGLGVGLAVVKQLVTLHGGTVDARSDGPGRGSEFAVRLPAAE